MGVKYSKNFLKSYRKRIENDKKLETRFRKRLKLFLKEPTDSTLQDHKLTGTMKNLRAFSITGDIRVIYKPGTNSIVFIDVGKHTQVY